jgi:hypothetical protein
MIDRKVTSGEMPESRRVLSTFRPRNSFTNPLCLSGTPLSRIPADNRRREVRGCAALWAL